MKKIEIEPNTKPQGFRDWLAWKLVKLANWIRPGNEAGLAYLMNLVMESELESMKYGRSELEIKVRKTKNKYERKLKKI